MTSLALTRYESQTASATPTSHHIINKHPTVVDNDVHLHSHITLSSSREEVWSAASSWQANVIVMASAASGERKSMNTTPAIATSLLLPSRPDVEWPAHFLYGVLAVEYIPDGRRDLSHRIPLCRRHEGLHAAPCPDESEDIIGRPSH